MRIYTITTFEKIQPALNDYVDTGDFRCIGWFLDFNTADALLTSDESDIYQMDNHPFAVIETVSDGLYPDDCPRAFYRYNIATHQYQRNEEPPEIAYICSFGIG